MQLLPWLVMRFVTMVVMVMLMVTVMQLPPWLATLKACKDPLGRKGKGTLSLQRPADTL